jgi:hypothetical protein
LEPAGTTPPSSIHILDVRPNVPGDISGEISDLELELVQQIRGLGAVKQVSLGGMPPEPEGALLIEVSIRQIRKVSRAKRLFLGEMAGRASMTAGVEFIDGKTGAVLGRYEVVGKSGNTEFSGGTGDAVEKTAEAIVAIMTERCSWIPERGAA